MAAEFCTAVTEGSKPLCLWNLWYIVVRLSTQTDGAHDTACCRQVPHSRVRVGQRFVRTVQPGGRKPLHWRPTVRELGCQGRKTPTAVADSRSRHSIAR